MIEETHHANIQPVLISIMVKQKEGKSNDLLKVSWNIHGSVTLVDASVSWQLEAAYHS